jgi:predicted GIY-YIG superfamily endonuclease
MLQYVYILRCADNKIYVGCTNNLRDRTMRHNRGYNFYTKGRLPVKLIFYCCFLNKYLAYGFEKYLKSGSGRAFMLRHLIRI